MNKFSEKLKELREEKGLSQSMLAKETGFTQPAITMWESSKRVPSFDVVIKFAKYFKVSTDFFAGLEDYD